MAVDYEKIGKRIKYYRVEKRLSQEELSEMTNITYKHLSNIETGNRRPSLEIVISIANALEVSSDDILTDSLKSSSSPAGTAIQNLLLDCNHDEIEMLTRTLKFLKALFTEFGI